MKNRVETLGLVALILGITMLVFTFISAYLFLTEDLNILASSDLMGLFGEALAPLIATVIRVMYLGIMGWIGSLVTVRGTQLLKKISTKPSPRIKEETSPEAEFEAAFSDAETAKTKPTKKRPRQKPKGKKGE